MARRQVQRSDSFVAKAKGLFPPGGNPEGRASFELFERLVLRGVEEQFARQFDRLPVAVPEVPAIRHVMTHAVPYFPALIVYAVLLEREVVELVDLEVDEDYFDLIGDDPDD